MRRQKEIALHECNNRVGQTLRPRTRGNAFKRQTSHHQKAILTIGRSRGCSSMVEHQLPKLNTRVRFPSPASTVTAPGTVSFSAAEIVHGSGFPVCSRLLEAIRIRIQGDSVCQFAGSNSTPEPGRPGYLQIPCFT